MIRQKIQIEETNILLQTDIKNHELYTFLIKQRAALKNYIKINPDFLITLEPIPVSDGPLIVKMMSRAALKADVGPMAAVAGTISQLSLGFLLRKKAKEVIVDNGGDIAIKTNKKVTVGLYAGGSPLSGEVGFLIKSRETPMGICTSSGTVGHSMSFGIADSVTVFSKEASVADALATSIANYAVGDNDNMAVENSLTRADELREYFRGILVVVGESAGTLGKIPKLIKTDKKVVLGDLFEV